jgi:two-component system response regulator
MREAESERQFTILLAEDDADDRELAREALADSGMPGHMRFVVDGQDLIDYLRRQGDYTSDSAAPWPSIILLDLNMPRKSGTEALAEIREDRSLRRIPVVILTTSDDQRDVERAYDLGANSYITKPYGHEELVEVMNAILDYWGRVTELPPQG